MPTCFQSPNDLRPSWRTNLDDGRTTKPRYWVILHRRLLAKAGSASYATYFIHPLVAVTAGMTVGALASHQATGVHRGNGMMADLWDERRAQGWPRSMHRGLIDGEFDYLAEMVAHHREAVVAARELSRSDRPQMRAFGRSIVKVQSAQIDLMTSWLADWYPGRSTEVAYVPMMRDLSGLSGDRMNEAFLRDMIGHHMSAVMESQALLSHRLGEHPEVNLLARSIRDDQHKEIILMRRWLADWYGSGRWHHAI